MIQFDKEELATARANFPAVFVDRVTPAMVTGSRTATAGDQVRIFVTDWFYAEPETFKTNEQFLAWMKKAREELEFLE